MLICMVSYWKRDKNTKKVNRKSWTKEEDLFIMSNPIKASATTLKRTVKSVSMRKWRLQKVTE